MSRRSPTTSAVLDAHAAFGKLEDVVRVERRARAQRRRRGLITLACLAAGGLAGFAVAVLGQFPEHRLALQPNLPHSSGVPFAFFEFAPAGGNGMGTACACTTPTGAKGEAMTFTRASSGTCLKTIGAAPQTIANGDMVTCSTNQPRVMAGADGTTVLGLLVEGAGTNGTLRSQELTDPAWSANGDVATITSNFAVAPDGTLTAERFQFPALAAGHFSQVFQLGSCPASAPRAFSLWARNNAAGSAKISMYAGTGCTECTVDNTGWTRCLNLTGTSTSLAFGSVTSGAVASCPSATLPSSDVLIWGVQCESGSFASSYIATTSATVTRATEATPYVTLSAPITGAASIAASFVAPVTGHSGGNNALDIGGDGVVGLALSTAPDASTLAVEYDSHSNVNCYHDAEPAASDNVGVLGFGATQGFADRASCATTGGGAGQIFSGGIASSYAQAIPGFAADPSNIVTIGGWSTAAPPLNGVIKRVCVDPTRCVVHVPLTRLAWVGDSIVYGYPTPSSSPPVQLTTLIGSQSKQVVDLGHNGDHATPTCAAKWTTNVQGRGYSTLIWSCAVNDILFDQTGSATATAVEATLASALADGERVIVTGIMPFKGYDPTPSRLTEAAAYNSLISAWASGHGATYVDPSSMGGQGGDPNVLLVAYDSGDHIHPSPAGQLKLAQLVQAVSP